MSDTPTQDFAVTENFHFSELNRPGIVGDLKL